MRRLRPRGGASFGARASSMFLWCACLASAAGGDETSSASGTPRSAPTLLVSFDGFRASYLDAQDPSALPELTALWRGGVRAALRPRFISKTFPNHYSLVTGLNEQTHGIVANRFFDPDANASFTPASNASFWWDGGEPLWVTAVRDGRDARVYFWPGSETEIKGVRPTEFRAYEKTESFDGRVDVVARWVLDAVHENKSKRPFFAVYFEEPDASGHVHGPRAEETKAAVRRVDDALRRLRVAVGDAVWNEINVIAVADHGMAELDASRAVFLADEPCGVPFRDLHVEGSDVVMHVWPRTSATRNGTTSFPVDPADPSAAWFDARALAEKVEKCHAFVKAWTRESVPSRFAYGGNRRVGPVVIAADVGWTLCGANASRYGDASSGDAFGNDTSASNASYAHERDWAAEHSGCLSSLRAAAGHRGAHGFDNDAPEMRAVFIARGPSFRKDGARLLAGDGDVHEEVIVATGRDADVDALGADTNPDLDAAAAAWESRTFVFDNTAVFAIAARALGLDLDDARVLADGRPFPRVDGVLGKALRDALFDAGDEDEDEDDARSSRGSRRAVGLGSAVAFLAAACASFAAFTSIDRRLTGRWPFERARAVLVEMDAEQTLPEMELVGVAETRRSGADG